MLICWPMQAKLELDILRRVHDLVKADYVDSRPRLHLPSAREEEYNPDASCIFLVNYEKFRTMSVATKLAIIRHRDILIEDYPQDEFGWDLETLMQLGSVEQSRDIQGNFCVPHRHHIPASSVMTVGQLRGDDTVPGMLKVGNLKEVLMNASDRALNCLSLPTSAHKIVDTPGFRCVCTAFLILRFLKAKPTASWLPTRTRGVTPVAVKGLAARTIRKTT
jgi:hypothetical protein